MGEIPGELWNLTALSSLDLGQNQLAGTIPTEIGNLKMLEDLDLSLNNLGGNIPNEIGQLTSLTQLHLYGNRLIGTIPAELGKLTTLDHLGLGDNQLTGNIPAELGQLTALISLNLDRNKLTGTIPTELGNLTELKYVYASGNALEGCIPDPWRLTEHNDFDRLEILYCGDNPSDPDDRAVLVKLYSATNGGQWHNNENWLSDQPLLAWHGVNVDAQGKVTELDLSWNNLNGALIREVGQLEQLTTLRLTGNQLSGRIPSEIGNLALLEDLMLSVNELTGQIPIELAELDELWRLHLNNNKLSGQIPAGIGKMSDLAFLNLGRNNLSGAIPQELANLANLQVLHLASNELTGSLPTWIGDLRSLEHLGLGNNGFSGHIPTMISQMTYLEELDLSGNDLSGPIPRLTSLTNLTDLILASNKLTGEFPTWVVDLRSLQRLTLGGNQLTGDVSLISEHLEELRHLNQFTIAGNDFAGCIPESLRNIEHTDFLFSELNYCDEPQKLPPTTPAFIKWEIGDEVRAIEERAARLGVQWLFEYAESVGWPIVEDDITVYVMTLEPLAYASAIEDGTIHQGEIESQREFISGIGGFARGDSNFNKATEVGDAIFSPYTLAETVIHENIHTAFQFDISGLHTGPSSNRQRDESEPAWYTEGMASYFDGLITSIHGGAADFLCRDCEPRIDGVRVPVSEIHLSSAEDRDTCEYICGALAIELLASIVGQRHIVDFYTMQRPGQTWQRAFKEAFNISVPDFYALYDQHRAAGFPELNPPIVPETGR